MAQMVKHLPTMLETRVQSLGGEDPLEEEMATQVFLPGKSHEQRSLAATVHGMAKSWSRLSNFTFTCGIYNIYGATLTSVVERERGHRVATFLILMVFTWNSVTFKLKRCEKVVDFNP